MARKNIFQIVEENYNIQLEIRKINKLFNTEEYFETSDEYYSFKKLIEYYLFTDWKFRGTCISIDEYLDRVNAHISIMPNIPEETIINNLEAMENFVKLFFDNSSDLRKEYGVQ